MSDQDSEIWVESLYGARTDAPLVKLIADGHEYIMPPEKARQIAQWLTEAAEAAYGDAFLVRFMEHRIGADRGHAVQMLREFRNWRELQRRAGREVEEADQEGMNG